VAKQKNKSKNANSLRIIGGKWRSRVVEFPDSEGLRPTPDRVRETVFNWLQMQIGGARCLDLFAGSGALGFEAASRGAEQVTLVESNHKVAATLTENLSVLKADNCQVITQSALDFVSSYRGDAVHLVFIDPPYQADLWSDTAALLTKKKVLADNALIYLEYASKQQAPLLPDSWHLLKDKVAGEVHYCLYQYQPEDTQ
jgi:16S rRNA (guanine966-N2)-methyltransferase